MTHRAFPFAWLGGSLLVLLLALTSVAKGSSPVPLRDVLSAVAGPLAPRLGLHPVEVTVQRIVQELRLPRALLAAMVGAGLAMVGALLQTATRNDLADPYLFGLSSGASAGAVAVITTTGEWLGIWTLPLAALAGGLLSALAVLLMVNRSRNEGPEKLVLAGLATSFVFGALTHYLVFAGDQRAAHSVLFWSLGGLGLARWDNLALALAGVGLLALYAAARRHALDGLLAGDETAQSLGLRPDRLRAEIFMVSAMATACFVSLTGVIGFVGLMVPHLVRPLCGALHTRLLAACAMAGAALLLASDIACRTLLSPQELPIGIVTAAVGALFVIALVLRSPPAP